MKKQMRNVSKLLGVLVLVVGTIGFLTGCPITFLDSQEPITVNSKDGTMTLTFYKFESKSDYFEFKFTDKIGYMDEEGEITVKGNFEFNFTTIALYTLGPLEALNHLKNEGFDGKVLKILDKEFDLSEVINRLKD